MRPNLHSTLRRARLASFLLIPCLAASCVGKGSANEAEASTEEILAKTVTEEVEVEEATAPGAPASLNAGFKSDELNVASFLERFEGESREVYAQRESIVAALDLQPGQAVADIGSGTGLYSILFAHGVGPTGKVYGVDIASKFIAHLGERAYTLGLDQVEAVLCTDKSTNLDEGSIDAAFICDTYHHFEYPLETMASLFEALRPGGQLMIVDFKRIPGVTREWMLNHVRCGKEQVIAEIESVGFRRLDDPVVPGLTDNYVLLFERP